MEVESPRITEVTPPVPEPDPVTFVQHQEWSDDFTAEVNAELRRRGFHACEAFASVDWVGQIVLHKFDMTAANGVFNVNCRMPGPWQTEPPADVATILNTALDACERGMIELCSRAKALRVSFAAHGRRVSQTIVTPPVCGNGKSRILTA
jgi:hypothetical protein